MSILFEIKDRKHKKVRLTKQQWAHIIQEHPDVSNVEEIKDTILVPTAVKPSIYDPENAKWYYRYNKQKKRYMVVAVKYINEEGFIITAHYRRTIK